jgi:hypothetical protein
MAVARELEPHTISDTPDDVRLAEEVAGTGVALVLKRAGEELAILSPVRTDRRASARRRIRAPSSNAWLDDLVGIGTSSGPSDVLAKVHGYVAEAIRVTTSGQPKRRAE